MSGSMATIFEPSCANMALISFKKLGSPIAILTYYAGANRDHLKLYARAQIDRWKVA